MKKIVILLTLAFIVISACMIYLTKAGVSLRSAPIIRPSPIAADFHNIAHGVIYRLSPEFQKAHYVLWGLSPQNEETQKVLDLMKAEYEKTFPLKVSILVDAEKLTSEQLRGCEKPCWLILPRDAANELETNEFIQRQVVPLQREYFSISWMPFTEVEEVPEFCIKEKRLTLGCLQVLSIQEAQRRMKSGVRHFFMKKYLDRDFFLFIQETPQI